MRESKHLWRGLFFILLITALCGGLALPVLNTPARAAPQMQVVSHLVISQVYGSGGNANATYRNDYVELFNPSDGPLSLDGYSIQYAPATGTTLFGVIATTPPLSGSLASGQFYLIQLGAGTNGSGSPLPTPDATGSTNISGGDGKVALVNTTTPLPCNGGSTPCTDLSSVVDLVGYGNADFYEGTAAAPGPNNNTTAVFRNSNGCFDTNNNATDFVTSTPTPHNTVFTPIVTCSVQLTSTAAVITGTASAVNATGTAAFDQTATALASATVTTITADTPDPSLVNQDVTVSVTVTGSTVPTGTVTITGADVNCPSPITLSNGSGSCIVRFTSTGAKTITATYSGDLLHTPSSDTEAHQVSTPATSTNTPSMGSADSVVISEFRTRGPNGADDEFVEIYNPTTSPVDISGWILSASNKDGAVQNRATIPASTLLRSGQYYLIAHNNYVIPSGGVSPNLRYGTSITNDGGVAILNASGVIMDEVGMSEGSYYQETAPGGDTLPPFSGTSNGSYERKDGGDLDSCVDTDDNESDFLDATSGTLHNYASPLSLCGSDRPTPSTTTTLITADTPDPSAINGNVSVSVRVTGGSTTPTGRVNITGANTNCSITLNASGIGSCIVKFTSNGIRTLTAVYLGDNTHASSTDTESHQVGSTTAVRTPTRVPTAIPPPPLIAINEFVPRPGHDWNNDGVINTGDEYIELLNHGVIDVNLSGYSLDDEVNLGSSPFRLPGITLKPGERRVFYGSETGLLLSDGGDGVRLLKPNGQLGDAYNYTVVRFPDQSYCRLPDNGGADDWNQNCFPTPGLQNSLSGSAVNPPTSGDVENLCPIADTLPVDFVFAECSPFGNNIWNPAYWDRTGWYGERNLPQSPGKWNVFVD